MLNKEDVTKGQEVIMGRPNGMKARCRIKRVNDKTCTVILLEKYGNGRGSSIGSEWRIPYSSLYLADGTSSKPVVPVSTPLVYNMFTQADDALIIQAIGQIHNNLSPENLSCDGELPITEVRRRYRAYNKKLDLLQKALGRTVSEMEFYEWDKARKASMEESKLVY